MTAGRPTKYDETILEKAREYLDACIDEIEEFHKTRGEKSDSYERIIHVRLPKIEGLARHLKVHKSTIFEWEATYPEFSDFLEELRNAQAEALIDAGLAGAYSPVIAKLLLHKHGYQDVKTTDITSGGKRVVGFGFVLPDEDDESTNSGSQTDNQTN